MMCYAALDLRLDGYSQRLQKHLLEGYPLRKLRKILDTTWPLFDARYHYNDERLHQSLG